MVVVSKEIRDGKMGLTKNLGNIKMKIPLFQGKNDLEAY